MTHERCGNHVREGVYELFDHGIAIDQDNGRVLVVAEEILTAIVDVVEALDWLDTGYRIHDPGMQNLKTDPLLDPVRGQARYQAVLARMKFPD
jgi:hypothetical protein